MSRVPELIARVQNAALEDGAYRQNRAIIGGGGQVACFGMGRPYIEKYGENAMLRIPTGFIAAIEPVIIEDGETVVHKSGSIDFITTETIAGRSLALSALQDIVAYSKFANSSDHTKTIGQILPVVDVSIIAVDRATRLRVAESGVQTTPDDAETKIMFPAFDPAVQEVRQQLFFDTKDNTLTVSYDEDSTIHVADVYFENRTPQEAQVVPSFELMHRKNWRVVSKEVGGVYLQVCTASPMVEITEVEQEPARGILEQYQIGGSV